MSSAIQTQAAAAGIGDIAERVFAGERLSREDGVRLYEQGVEDGTFSHWHADEPFSLDLHGFTQPTAAAAVRVLRAMAARFLFKAGSKMSDISPANSQQPDVAIVMGSRSDWPTMEKSAAVLGELGVAYAAKVVSAHRTPDRLVEFSKSARKKGIKVIIAGAGGAAHLPGMVASMTSLPVLGVPVKSKALSGKDSLLSIVQMPRGVPVATVAIGNAANAGLLAVRMLGMADEFAPSPA